jgi:hypothetical protein
MHAFWSLIASSRLCFSLNPFKSIWIMFIIIDLHCQNLYNFFDHRVRGANWLIERQCRTALLTHETAVFIAAISVNNVIDRFQQILFANILSILAYCVCIVSWCKLCWQFWQVNECHTIYEHIHSIHHSQILYYLNIFIFRAKLWRSELLLNK